MHRLRLLLLNQVEHEFHTAALSDAADLADEHERLRVLFQQRVSATATTRHIRMKCKVDGLLCFFTSTERASHVKSALLDNLWWQPSGRVQWIWASM
jgi:hypothetical protein